MRTRRVLLALASVTAVTLGACADGSTDPGQTPSPSPALPTTPLLPTGSPAPGTPPPTFPVPVPTPPQPAPTDRTGLATISGEVYAGVEPNCVLLRTAEGADYLLFGPAAGQVDIGDSVTLRGYPRPDMATTCQQGVAFEVTEVVD